MNNYIFLKEFKIDDLFTSVNGDTDIKKENINNKGVAVVSSGLENFGFIGKTDIKAKIISKNTITVDMFGNVFYRSVDYKMVTHARVFALIPKNFVLNECIGLYICTMLNFLSSIFNYNNMCSFNKVKELKIYLPAKEDGNPDWEYMNQYIHEIKKSVLADVIKWKDQKKKFLKELSCSSHGC